MSYVNAFIQAGNEHRRVSIGGRGANNKTWAWLNCATADGEKAVRIKAEVYGTTSSRERRKGDTRKAHFEVELPEPGEFVSVEIREAGAGLADLARIGAMLCGLKGAQQIVAGDHEQGVATIQAAAKIVAELEDHLTDLPDVTLPGGVPLKHALACVELVRRITNGTSQTAN